MDVAIVKVENLYHRYSSQWAIQDISFEINQTGVLGLLGSNGAREIDHDEYHVWRVETDEGRSVY